MRLKLTTLFICLLLVGEVVFCQSSTFDKVQFFKDELILPVTIEANWKNVFNHSGKKGRIFPARIRFESSDSTSINEKVQLEARGKFRRNNCEIPPVKISFNKNNSSTLQSLKSLKLVNACKNSTENEQYIFKEYLVYKIYNVLTDKSFRVRLLNLEYKDSSGDSRTFKNHAFLIEDVKDLAKRNNCKEWPKLKINTEATNKKQITLVALFEYMIGNADWSVPINHNIKLIQSKDDTLSRPFAIPYDFDYSGLVNTDYAIPDPIFEIEKVTQRIYRGFPRTMDELNEALSIFIEKKDTIYSLIQNFPLLSNRNKKEMIDYLEEFYDIIRKQANIKSIFITNARRE